MKIKLDTSDKVFEVASVLFVIATAVIVAVSLPGLPDEVPNHFDMDGKPNQYGSKNFLWVTVVISVFIYMLLGIISMFPESFNYPSQKNDKESQYKLGVKLLRSMRACFLLFITILTVIMVQSAKTGSVKGTWGIIGIVPAFILINLIWFFVRWKKIK